LHFSYQSKLFHYTDVTTYQRKKIQSAFLVTNYNGALCIHIRKY
jgi:hypothetical protein